MRPGPDSLIGPHEQVAFYDPGLGAGETDGLSFRRLRNILSAAVGTGSIEARMWDRDLLAETAAKPRAGLYQTPLRGAFDRGRTLTAPQCSGQGYCRVSLTVLVAPRSDCRPRHQAGAAIARPTVVPFSGSRDGAQAPGTATAATHAGDVDARAPAPQRCH